MSRNLKIYLGFFFIILVIMGIFQLNQKALIDWTKSFDVNSKEPFGLYVLDQEANHLFNNQLERVRMTPYEYYTKEKRQSQHNIIVIENDIDLESWKKILQQVEQGSNAMIVSRSAPKEIQDSLGVLYSRQYYDNNFIAEFTDKKLKDTLHISTGSDKKIIERIGPKVEILGNTFSTKPNENSKYANFVTINFGQGQLYLHTEPIVLTNYYLLKSRSRYPSKLFSFLPQQKTIWFTEKSLSKNQQSPMRFILSNLPLRYALYIGLVGLLLFMIFNAKRKQRIIPTVEPIKNTTLEFVKSIGNLYLQEGNFHDMMAKKSQYFLHKIRTDLLIDTSHLDQDFINKLHLKTGAPVSNIQQAVDLMKKAQDPYAEVLQEEFIKMNKLLDMINK